MFSTNEQPSSTFFDNHNHCHLTSNSDALRIELSQALSHPLRTSDTIGHNTQRQTDESLSPEQIITRNDNDACECSNSPVPNEPSFIFFDHQAECETARPKKRRRDTSTKPSKWGLVVQNMIENAEESSPCISQILPILQEPIIPTRTETSEPINTTHRALALATCVAGLAQNSPSASNGISSAERAKALARFVGNIVESARIARMLARAYLFLFLSYCVVLEESDRMSEEQVNDLMRHAFSKAGAPQLR